MSSLCILFLALGAEIPAPPIEPRPKQRIHGVLSNRPVESFCTIFEADDGRNFILSTTGGFQLGDRIYVEGNIATNVAGVCNEVLYRLLQTNDVRPAFAGVGTLVTQGSNLRLHMEDGREYALQNRGAFGVGASVYVRGWVDSSETPPRIRQNVIGEAVSGFGRYVGTSSAGRHVQGEDGISYVLDGLSARFVKLGDWVHFEGIRGPDNGGATEVLQSTGRYAFLATGPVVLEGGVKVIKSDQWIFDDTFRAPGLDAVAVGEKAFVFGVAPEDYDYGEARNGRSIRSSRTGLGYSSTGTFVNGEFVASDSTELEVDYHGTLPPNQLVYIAGELDMSGPGSPKVHSNIVFYGIDTTGTLEIGFECVPLLIGSGVFFVEDEEGIPIYNSVHAIGGVSFDAAPCPFLAIIDDQLIDLGGGKKK